MLRSPQHLITEPSYKRLLSSTQALNKQEFAFIKRSNGSFSYAILAHRSMEPVKQSAVTSCSNNGEVLMEEECMTFVMNETGSTKMIRQSNWGEHVRLVAECTQEELDKLEETKKMEKFLQCFDSRQSSPSRSIASCQKAVPPQEEREHVRLIAEYPQEEQDKLEEKKNMEKFLQCFDSRQSSPSQSIASCHEFVVPKSQEPTQVVYQQVIQTDARKDGVYDNVALPNIISCTRLTYEEDDDCSSVSSASEYARYYEQYFC